MSNSPPAEPRVDARALGRVAQRLAQAAEPPWLHGEVARRMADRLPLVRLQPGRVLDWSGHAGASTELLAHAYPQAVMSAAAPDGQPPLPPAAPRRRWPFARRPVGPARVLAGTDVLPADADLLWSNMSLHLSPDPKRVLAQWQRALAVGGFLMFSTLGPGTGAELRSLYQRHGWGDPMAPYVDMHDLGDDLVRAGFADPVMDQETLTLTWADGAAMLSELRALGANASPGRFAGCRTPRWLAQLQAALVRDRPDGRAGLSIEVVYGHAFRVATPARMQGETEVSLQDMREHLRGTGGRRT